MGAHAPLAPSGAPIWGECSGSVIAQMQHPNPETQETRNGTASHWVGGEVLLNYKHTDRGPLLCSDYIGRTAPNGVVIDEKMADGAQVWVDDVLAICQKFGALQSLVVEHRVHMPDIHEHNWGTLDTAVILLVRGVLYLWDYKHGHRKVSAQGNLQLIDYMKGLVNELQIDGHTAQQITVVFRIVQPFSYSPTGPIDEWVVPLTDLRPYWNTLAQKAHEAFTNPRLTTGPWCRDCTAVKVCAAARGLGYELLHVIDAPYAMDVMSSRDLGVERELLRPALAVLKARVEAIEDEIRHRIVSGDGNTGYTVQSTSGNLAWKDTVTPKQAAALATQFGYNIAKDAVMTPTQAIAAAPAAVRPMVKEIMKSFAHRPAGALTLTRAEESRAYRAFRPERKV